MTDGATIRSIVPVSDRTIEAVWHMESAKIIATLARMLRDVGRAEELAQDALVIALEQWPAKGIPDNPAAWLMTTAKRRAIDELRHRQLVQRKHTAMKDDPDPMIRTVDGSGTQRGSGDRR